jgi:hypothetical protein
MAEDHGSKANHDVDLSKVFSGRGGASIDEGERLRFARQVLFWLAVICVGVFIAHGMYPDNQAVAQIFELVKIGALPLVTLVVSFYFPNSSIK